MKNRITNLGKPSYSKALVSEVDGITDPYFTIPLNQSSLLIKSRYETKVKWHTAN